MATETASKEQEVPKALPVAETTEEGKLAQVRRDVNTETRKKAIEKGDPIAKMELNLAWARQYPNLPLAKSIDALKSYGDLKTDRKAAEAAVAKMVEIQKMLGMSDAAQDGIIGRGTLKAAEDKSKAKEQENASKLIADFDQSYNASRLVEDSAKLKSEIGAVISSGNLDIAAMEKLRKTVKDGAGNEYTVSRGDKGQTQYTNNKSGEVFKVTDGKLSPVSKLDLAIQRGGKELDTIIDDELRDNFNFDRPLTPEFINKMRQNPKLQKNFIIAYNDFQKKNGKEERVLTTFLSGLPQFGLVLQEDMKNKLNIIVRNSSLSKNGETDFVGIKDTGTLQKFTKLAIQTREGFADLPEPVQKSLLAEIDGATNANELTRGKALNWVNNWPGITNPVDIKRAIVEISEITGGGDSLPMQLALLASKGLNTEQRKQILASSSMDDALALLEEPKKTA